MRKRISVNNVHTTVGNTAASDSLRPPMVLANRPDVESGKWRRLQRLAVASPESDERVYTITDQLCFVIVGRKLTYLLLYE